MTKAEAFLRQAASDFSIYERLEQQRQYVPLCHRLHYLQMATEKLAKAAALRGDPDADIYNHIAFTKPKFWQAIERQAPVIADGLGYSPAALRKSLVAMRPLSHEIENLSPDVMNRRHGSKGVTPNAEYPWEGRDSNGALTWLAPADHDFPELSDLPTSVSGVRLVQLIKRLLDRFDRIF